MVVVLIFRAFPMADAIGDEGAVKRHCASSRYQHENNGRTNKYCCIKRFFH